MKKLLFALSLLASATSFAQPNDQKSPPNILLQLGYTGNVYYNTLTPINVGTGLLLDTTSNATVLTLQTVNYAFLTQQSTLNGVKIPKVNADTLYPLALNGNGQLSFFAKVWKVTGTDTITVTPVQSLDGKGVWTPVPGITVQTLTPTSLTVPLEADFTINTSGLPIWNSARHYGIQFKGNGSSTMSVIGYIKDYSK